ncbi:MAG TPA: hypothetical protein DHN33_05775 [Eubacteriaceae bacterium]|nr:hypothetical protein [Eubacteriaceae bacterium]
MKKTILIFSLFLFSILLFGCSQAPQKPVVSGVEDGEVYGGPVEITLNEPEENTEYEAKINDEEYELGASFAKEGMHTLTVTASRNGETAEATLDFEIDTTPPKTPQIKGVQEGEIYFERVNITVQEEEGVTHTATINGKPYDFNTPFEEEGEHTLKVEATKAKNNLSTEKSVDFIIDNTTYTQEEVDYFTEIALGAEYGGSPM